VSCTRPNYSEEIQIQYNKQCSVTCQQHDSLIVTFDLLFKSHSSSSIYFLARDSIYAIARSLLTPVRPSVRLSVPLSVTRVDQSKTVTARITQPSPQSSPMTLVSSRGTAP